MEVLVPGVYSGGPSPNPIPKNARGAGLLQGFSKAASAIYPGTAVPWQAEISKLAAQRFQQFDEFPEEESNSCS